MCIPSTSSFHNLLKVFHDLTIYNLAPNRCFNKVSGVCDEIRFTVMWKSLSNTFIYVYLVYIFIYNYTRI